MKLRSQFTLAFFFLAVVPLAVIVLYSYASSQKALRQVVAAEAEGMTREMEERMAAVRLDLARRVHRVGELPLRQAAAPDGATGDRGEVMAKILDELGESAPFVRSFEFTPRPGVSPLVVESAEAPNAPEAAASAAPAGGEASSPGFVIFVEKIVEEMDQKLAAELEGRELTDEEKASLERARSGVEAAVTVVEGLGRIARVFGSGDPAEIELGGMHLSFGGDEGDEAVGGEGGRGSSAPVVEMPEPPRPPAPLPAGEASAREMEAWHRSMAAWQLEWQAQQEEWRQRFVEWEESSRAEARRAAAAGGAGEEVAERDRATAADFYVPVREAGEVVGAVRARISTEQVLRGVLERTRQDQGEVPFAVGADGTLYTLDEDDRERLEPLPLTPEARASGARRPGDWVVATSDDPASGLTYGIARPIGESVAEMRTVAARNFALGLGLLLVAIVGMRPLSRRLTDSLGRLNEGVERIGRGDLEARVEVESRNEVGQLAGAFNRMAGELREQQAKLLAQERRRRGEEVKRKLLEAEYARKSEELEQARRFQLSLLPDRLPQAPGFELAVKMDTATEVGGDYYDFRLDDEGTLTCAIGDATGHGARAGTMVTVIKSLFSAFDLGGDLSAFLGEAGRTVRRMQLGRMAMALTLVQLRGASLRLAAAGMPPALLHRGGGGVEELMVEGMPLGGLDTTYRQVDVGVEPGDTVLLMTDGLPELPDAGGEPFGYRRVRGAFAELASLPPAEIVAGLRRQAESWAGEGPPNDDMTFVVLRVR